MYIIKDYLKKRLDPRNKYTVLFNFAFIFFFSTSLASMLFPRIDTSIPTHTEAKEVKANIVAPTFQEQQDINFRLCVQALNKKRDLCERNQDNRSCDKWMRHLQIGCKHYQTTWTERNQ